MALVSANAKNFENASNSKIVDGLIRQAQTAT